ncbi:MAG: TonB-dependent receptor [Gammaproteobacteria bacterium]|nr:TonB-dependent receptor [Gammaproteobacteria bacterium]
MVGDKFAIALKRLIWLALLAVPVQAADPFFEQELAHSALEQLKARGIHNDLLTAYLYDFSVDKALSIEEMPINLPFNGQGQGYINTNFLIKELIVDDTTRRGPYSAEDGDFAGSGALQLFYRQRPNHHQLTLGLGEDAYHHAIANGAFQWGDTNIVYGLETIGQDTAPDLRNSSAANGSDNAVVKIHGGDVLRGYQVNLMAHQADWKSESPKTIDPDSLDADGAENLLDAVALEDSHRFSISTSAWLGDSRHRWEFTGYAMDYDSQLDLEFVTVDSRRLRISPIERRDDRVILGGSVSHDWFFTQYGHHQLGLEARLDALKDVGLSDVRTNADQRNNGDADLYTGAIWYRNQYQWNQWLRHEFGLRLDALDISPAPGLALDYDSDSDERWSPKLSVIANPWENTELFFQVGRGIHSNDGRYSYRGINTRRSTSNPPEQVRPLGAVDALDLGFSTRLFEGRGIFSTSLWYREAEYELAARNAQVELRPSERKGVEFRFLYQPSERLYLDLAAVLSKARFTDDDPNGKHIPGSTEQIATFAVGYLGDRYYINLDALFLGPSPFLEDNSAETDPVSSIDLYIGGNIGKNLTVELQWLNIADNDRNNSDVSFIDRVAAAEAFVEELYYNPIPARTLRVYLRYYL